MPPKTPQVNVETPKQATPPIKYGIFFLYFDDQKLQQIAQNFIEDLQKNSRRVVVGFTREQIVNEMVKVQSSPLGNMGNNRLSEGKKEKDKKTEKRTSEVRSAQTFKKLPEYSQNFILDETNFNQFVNKIHDKINEHVKISETLQNVVKRRKEFDLLQHWMGNKGIQKVKKPDEKSLGSKKSIRSQGGADKKVKDVKLKDKTSKKEEIKKPCNIKTINSVKLDEKFFSKFQPRIQNVSVKVKYTEDHPLDALDAYIVLIGKFEKEIIYELVQRGLPLRSISFFFPEQMRPRSEAEAKSIKILNTVEDLRHANELRQACIMVRYIRPISEYRATALRNAIYDQLSFHFYDEEAERRQYENYLAHLHISDVSAKYPFTSLKVLSESDLPMNALDDITVPIYLDSLLDIIHENLLETSSNIEEEANMSLDDEEDDDPFITTPCNTSVFEDANKLLKNTLASEIDLTHYKRALRVYKIAASLDKVFEDHAFIRKDMRVSIDNQDPYYSDERDVNVFCEPLSQDTFLQNLKVYSDKADQTEIFYNSYENNIIFSFHQLAFNIREKNKVRMIRTKVCFRDYLKYVAPHITKWIEDQEHIYEAKKALKKVEDSFEEPEAMLNKREFYRKSSIKESLAQNEALSTKSEKNNTNAVSSKNATVPDLPEDKVVFPGYNLGKDVIRLRFLETKYKSKLTRLNFERNILDFGPEMFFLELSHAHNTIFFNQVNPSNKHIAKLRIETHNNITIAFDHMPMALPKNRNNENGIEETDNGIDYNISYPYVTMDWPSLLKVQNIYDPETQKLSEVRQYSWRKSIPEKQRFIYSDGSVLVFYLNKSIHVLTANGTIYQSGPLLDNIFESDQEMPEMEDEFAKMMNKFQYELYYIRRYYEHLDTENYLLTTAEGYNFKVQSGQIVQRYHKFLTLEWYDYELGERYSSREDGVKTLTSKAELYCYYPDGTLITSELKDKMLYTFMKDDEAESLILLPKEVDGHSASTVAVTESILKELVNIAISSGELFVFPRRSHLIQHECYATVYFIKEEKVDILSPGGVKLSFTGKEVNFDLRGELFLYCKEDECIMCSYKKAVKTDAGKDSQRDCTLTASINFKQDNHPLLRLVEGHRIITILSDFIWETASTGKHPRYREPQDSDLKLEGNHEGFELHPNNAVTNIIDNVRKQKGSIFYTSSDLKVLLQKFTKFNKIYRLPIAFLRRFLKKFEIHDFKCEEKQKEHEMNMCQKMGRIMTVRSFYKIDKMHRTMFQSAVNLLGRASSGITYGRRAVVNKATLITQAVNTFVLKADFFQYECNCDDKILQIGNIQRVSTVEEKNNIVSSSMACY